MAEPEPLTRRPHRPGTFPVDWTAHYTALAVTAFTRALYSVHAGRWHRAWEETRDAERLANDALGYELRPFVMALVHLHAPMPLVRAHIEERERWAQVAS